MIQGFESRLIGVVQSPTLTQAKLAAGHVITLTPRMGGVSAETNRLISSKPLAHGSPNVKVGEVAFMVPEWIGHRPRMGMRRAGAREREKDKRLRYQATHPPAGRAWYGSPEYEITGRCRL